MLGKAGERPLQIGAAAQHLLQLANGAALARQVGGIEGVRHLFAQRAETRQPEHAVDLTQDEHHGRDADDAQQRKSDPPDPILALERNFNVAREPQRGRQREETDSAGKE